MELPDELTEPPVCLVWPENLKAVEMFCRLEGQWRMGPRGPVALDYGAIRWLFSLYQVDRPRELLEDLRVMAAAFLAELYREAG